MAKYKITVDKATCIGCGACSVACDNFVMKGEKAEVVKADIDDLGSNQEACDNCPVAAIKIEKKG